MSLETQLKIANLRYENEELTKKNEKVTNTLKPKSQQLLYYSLRTTSWYSLTRSDNKIEIQRFNLQLQV